MSLFVLLSRKLDGSVRVGHIFQAMNIIRPRFFVLFCFAFICIQKVNQSPCITSQNKGRKLSMGYNCAVFAVSDSSWILVFENKFLKIKWISCKPALFSIMLLFFPMSEIAQETYTNNQLALLLFCFFKLVTSVVFFLQWFCNVDIRHFNTVTVYGLCKPGLHDQNYDTRK